MPWVISAHPQTEQKQILCGSGFRYSLQVPPIFIFNPPMWPDNGRKHFSQWPQQPSFLLGLLLWLQLSQCPPCAKSSPFRTSQDSGPVLPYPEYYVDCQSVDSILKLGAGSGEHLSGSPRHRSLGLLPNSESMSHSAFLMAAPASLIL